MCQRAQTVLSLGLNFKILEEDKIQTDFSSVSKQTTPSKYLKPAVLKPFKAGLKICSEKLLHTYKNKTKDIL